MMQKVVKISDKQHKELISEGVSFSNGKFYFDYKQNKSDDIINFRKLLSYKSKIFDNVYYYGFRFRKDVDSDVRTKFIAGIKNLSYDIPDEDRRKFLMNGVTRFLSTIKVPKFDALLYPLSERSPINNELVKLINQGIRVKQHVNFELVKNLPLNVSFDYDLFEANVLSSFTKDGKPRYTIKQRDEVLKNIQEMMKKINGLSYFSIAMDVKTKYRPYIRDFLKFKDEKSETLFKSLENKNVLIVDDINTSFSTINEIIRIVREVNNNVNIYVFTLIGKDF